MTLTRTQKYAGLMVLLFFIWGGISWQWYTCGIKGVCTENPTATQTKKCSPYITSYLKINLQNSTEDVQRLESFLNTYENEHLAPNGIYGLDDEAAIKRFQKKYKDAILAPWGITEASGFVFKTTQDHINTLYCTYTK